MKAPFPTAVLACVLFAPTVVADEAEKVTATMRSTGTGIELQQRGSVSEIVLDGIEGRQIGTSTEWQTVCRLPCDKPIDPKGTFRIIGLNITPSSAFTLPSSSGTVAIDVRAGSLGNRTTGFAMGTLGAAGMLLGTGLLVAAGQMEPPTSGPLAGPPFAQVNADAGRQASGLRTGGYVALGIGTVSLMVGAILYATSGTTVAISAK